MGMAFHCGKMEQFWRWFVMIIAQQFFTGTKNIYWKYLQKKKFTDTKLHT